MGEFLQGLKMPLIFFAAIKISIFPVCDEYKVHIQNRIVTKSLQYRFLSEFNFGPFALHNGKGPQGPVIDYYVRPVFLLSEFKRNLAPHQMEGNEGNLVKQPDKPAAHFFFRCQCNFLFSERIPNSVHIPGGHYSFTGVQ